MATEVTPATAGAGPFGRPFPFAFVDGDFVDEAEAALSVHANAVSYGTGTFEGIRCSWNEEQNELYLLEAHAHYERMARSARVLGRELPHTPSELVSASRELLRRNAVRSDAYLRPLYLLAGEDLTVRMHGIRARLSIAATAIVGDYISLAGVSCMISSWRRPPDVAMPSRAKLCGSYAGPALAKSEAVAAGYDEAIMLNSVGHVAEATTSNVFLRRGDEWLTPAVTDDILEGITRDQVKTLLAERTGRPVVERSIDRSELLTCDEVLLCGTAALVVPVLAINGRALGRGLPGEMTMSILADLRAIARRADERHHGWTTAVYQGYLAIAALGLGIVNPVVRVRVANSGASARVKSRKS